MEVRLQSTANSLQNRLLSRHLKIGASNSPYTLLFYYCQDLAINKGTKNTEYEKRIALLVSSSPIPQPFTIPLSPFTLKKQIAILMHVQRIMQTFAGSGEAHRFRKEVMQDKAGCLGCGEALLVWESMQERDNGTSSTDTVSETLSILAKAHPLFLHSSWLPHLLPYSSETAWQLADAQKRVRNGLDKPNFDEETVRALSLLDPRDIDNRILYWRWLRAIPETHFARSLLPPALLLYHAKGQEEEALAALEPLLLTLFGKPWRWAWKAYSAIAAQKGAACSNLIAEKVLKIHDTAEVWSILEIILRSSWKEARIVLVTLSYKLRTDQLSKFHQLLSSSEVSKVYEKETLDAMRLYHIAQLLQDQCIAEAIELARRVEWREQSSQPSLQILAATLKPALALTQAEFSDASALHLASALRQHSQLTANRALVSDLLISLDRRIGAAISLTLTTQNRDERLQLFLSANIFRYASEDRGVCARLQHAKEFVEDQLARRDSERFTLIATAMHKVCKTLLKSSDQRIEEFQSTVEQIYRDLAEHIRESPYNTAAVCHHVLELVPLRHIDIREKDNQFSFSTTSYDSVFDWVEVMLHADLISSDEYGFAVVQIQRAMNLTAQGALRDRGYRLILALLPKLAESQDLDIAVYALLHCASVCITDSPDWVVAELQEALPYTVQKLHHHQHWFYSFSANHLFKIVSKTSPSIRKAVAIAHIRSALRSATHYETLWGSIRPNLGSEEVRDAIYQEASGAPTGKRLERLLDLLLQCHRYGDDEISACSYYELFKNGFRDNRDLLYFLGHVTALKIRPPQGGWGRRHQSIYQAYSRAKPKPELSFGLLGLLQAQLRVFQVQSHWTLASNQRATSSTTEFIDKTIRRCQGILNAIPITSENTSLWNNCSALIPLTKTSLLASNGREQDLNYALACVPQWNGHSEIFYAVETYRALLNAAASKRCSLDGTSKFINMIFNNNSLRSEPMLLLDMISCAISQIKEYNQNTLQLWFDPLLSLMEADPIRVQSFYGDKVATKWSDVVKNLFYETTHSTKEKRQIWLYASQQWRRLSRFVAETTRCKIEAEIRHLNSIPS